MKLPLLYILNLKVLKFHDVYKYQRAKFMHHVQKKNSTYPIKEFFDDVKNDLNLNTSVERRKIKSPSF